MNRFPSGSCRSCDRQYRDREKENERGRKYRMKNPEKRRESNQRWRASNPGYYRKYRAANQEIISKQERHRYTLNPEKAAAKVHSRRARKRKNGGKLTTADIKFLKATFPFCVRCGIDVNLSIDHVIPLVRGGRNDIENIQILCRSCNSSKGIKVIDYRPSND